MDADLREYFAEYNEARADIHEALARRRGYEEPREVDRAERVCPGCRTFKLCVDRVCAECRAKWEVPGGEVGALPEL